MTDMIQKESIKLKFGVPKKNGNAQLKLKQSMKLGKKKSR